MKFSANTAELVNALATATHALSPRSTLPILEGILIETKETGIELTCSDGSMTITSTGMGKGTLARVSAMAVSSSMGSMCG